jgi:hypothetical protein
MSKSGTRGERKNEYSNNSNHKRGDTQMRDITTEPNRFGGIVFLVDKKEMGPLHGEKLADLPFLVEIRKELVTSGRALPHHIYPESGWVSCWIRNSDDIPAVLGLFEMQYERLR